MPDEKDRFGDKLREAERAREEQYFAERDRELIEKLRQAKAKDADATLREAAHMRCPKCGDHLRERAFHEVTVDECPGCGGIWLDPGEFEVLARRENEGWFGRLLRARTG